MDFSRIFCVICISDIDQPRTNWATMLINDSQTTVVRTAEIFGHPRIEKVMFEETNISGAYQPSIPATEINGQAIA